MPEPDGFHGTPFEVDGRMVVWHYCARSDHDTLVVDTPDSRRAHLRDCRKRTRALEARDRSEAKKRSIAALASVNAERKLEGGK